MKIIGLSLTHNDSSKGWLNNWLKNNSIYLDKWIILDDCSNDNTFEEIINFKKNNESNIRCEKNDKPMFVKHENNLRKKLWNICREEAEIGDWIIVLDSDELLTKEFQDIKKYCKSPKRLIFKKLEVWNGHEYRVDGLWSNFFERGFPFKDQEWGWNEKGFHFPQIPKYTESLKKLNTKLPIIHQAYMNKDFRELKLNFMKNNDQQKEDINLKHLMTIKDENPKLKEVYDYKTMVNSNGKLHLKNIVIDLSNCYSISDNIIKIMMKYDSVMKHIIFNETNINCMDQLKKLKTNLSLHRFYNKNNSMNILLDELEIKKGFTVFIKGNKEIHQDIIEESFSTDKNIVINNERNFLFINNSFLKIIRQSNFKNSFEDIFKIINRFKKIEYIWVIGEDFNPFPCNVHDILR